MVPRLYQLYNLGMRRQRLHRRVQRESQRQEITSHTSWHSLLNTAERLDKLPVRVFGHPEWQTCFRRAEEEAKLNGVAYLADGGEQWWLIRF